MGRNRVLFGSALAAMLAVAGGAQAEDLVVSDANGSYRYPADCAAAFENHAGIERYMKGRGREGELNAFNHNCSVYLSGNRVGRAGTGLRALGSDVVDELWRDSGARDFFKRRFGQ